MTNAVVNQKETPIARPLHVLVPLIKKDLEQGDEASRQAGIPYYRAAGEKLLEAQGQMKRGEWGPWVKRNFARSETQARLYMALADNVARATNSADAPITSLDEFKRSLGHNRPSTGRVQRDYQPEIDRVISTVDTAILSRRQDELKRAEERDAQRQLALQLIDIGYKALASKLHPDKGGSSEAMTRLNQVRDRLKASV